MFKLGLIGFLILLRFGSIHCKNKVELDPFDQFLEDIVPIILDQRPNNENGTDSRFEEYALNDESNEGLGNYTMQQIVARSGYKYKNYDVISKDGYITQVTRLINPRADPSKLKQPPVMMLHGGLVDSTVYVWASAIQHHPEPYPRAPEDGPMTSWNRSLAFMLANNGYDVWLIGTRGSDSQNQRHIRYKGPKLIDNSGEQQKEFFAQASEEALKYWDYSMDEVIEYELPSQIDKVLELTGAKNVTLSTYSLSTIVGPCMAAENPHYGRKVHNMIVMAPIMNNKGSSSLTKILQQIDYFFPYKFGTSLSTGLFSRFTREFLVLISKVRYLRYTFNKLIETLLAGPSAKYRTLLEPAVIGHIYMPTGFKYLQHSAQQFVSARLQKFDYGFFKNMLIYGQSSPPARDISNINIDNWLLISGTTDNLSPPSAVEQYLSEVGPKPLKHIKVEGFNHVDLVAAFENDFYVNSHILEFLDRFKLPPLSTSE